MKVTLLNVKYSPNLGDGIIAECFEHSIKENDPTIVIDSCDIAGRTNYGEGLNAGRQQIHQLLKLLPTFAKTLISANLMRVLIRMRLKSHYERCLSKADIALIGGGQLIADSLLNFPLKLLSASLTARAAGAYLVVYGVGVASSFTRKGKVLFEKAFSDGLLFSRVRDDASVDRWNSTFGTPKAERVNDPGLLTSRLYPAPRRIHRDTPLIGIGITHPNTLRLHADQNSGLTTEEDWASFFADLVESVCARNAKVELFTNGAGDDILFARKVAETLRIRTPHVLPPAVVDKMAHPRDLALCIAKYDAVIEHRLHANIIACSYSIPHIGLSWDSKMQGFFERAGRLRYLVEDLERDKISEITDLAFNCMDEGINKQQISMLMAETEQQIASLVLDLKRHIDDVSLQDTTNPSGSN